jgi:hypothetical protein
LERDWAANSWGSKGLLVGRKNFLKVHRPVIIDVRLA